MDTLFGVPVDHSGGRGVSVESLHGEPALRAVGYTQGVPAPWSGREGPEDEVVQDERVTCSETTKKGTPCRAPRAKGTDLCIGHLRSASTKES